MNISHTCEDGSAQPRIYFWHVLMHLKNKYLKKLLKWANKKQNNIYNAIFFKKKLGKTPRDITVLPLCTKILYDKIYSSQETETVADWNW